ncbi:cytochrome P450 [Marinobacterium mangrovicola]|uniref:Cytochrome P450 n=1 Tax=Marinobacterium mangrovicola TaxID=1476959 RepID=A0A4R1GFM9_9GAMM|nr:cytochrome P450 [Marinobacterium mangrovicola]TCK05660.1 cytochrome P450 [Marinobacterium mangrovicola]
MAVIDDVARVEGSLNDVLESEPVNVNRPKTWKGSLSSLTELRNNLLSVWPDRAYNGLTFSMQLLNQHYFVCNSPDTVKRVFLEEHSNYDQKSPQMRRALEPLLGDGLFVSDGELWKERRKACAPAFEAELLPGFAEVMVNSAQQMVESWERAGSETPIDMLSEMANLTSRIIGRTIFGDDTSEEEASQVVKGFTQYQQLIEQMSLADTFGLPYLRWLSNPFTRLKAIRAAGQVQAVIDNIIERHQAEPSRNEATLLSVLLNGYNGKKSGQKRCPLNHLAARNEAIVMFMAGHETTANSLAWTWYLLDHNPRAAAKLHEELDRVLKGRTPSLDDVPNLPYTRAVFEESMRLYPPVPLLSRQARAEDSIRGKEIHPGSIILVVPWLLHRHERFWEKPNQFIPERFMPDQPRPDKFVYLPFSVGHRVCLGLRFGLTEGILCLATLAQRFEARLKPDHEVDIECRLTLRPKGGLPMILVPRTKADM